MPGGSDALAGGGSCSGSRGWGVRPDMMTTAKAITNGYFPFGAVMISDKVAGVFESNKDAADWFDGLEIAAADKEKIGRTNAIKLFKLDMK